MDGYAVLNGYAVLYSAFAIGLVGDYDHTFIDEGLLPGVLAVAIRISPVLPVISVVFQKRLWNGGDGQSQCYCRRWRCCGSGRRLLGCCGTSWGRSGCLWACGVRLWRLGCGCPGSPGRWAGPEAAAWAGSAVLAAVESVVARVAGSAF